MEELKTEDGDIARLAVAVLAEELDVPVDNVTVDSVRAVQWRDSSIGCPQPGEAYLQVITPGHKIMLRVDKKRYAVHEARGRAFVCKRRKNPVGRTRERDRS